MGKKNKRKRTKGSADGPAARAFTLGCGTIAIGVVLLVLMLWVTALGWNANELCKGLLAANGHYGVPGTVTLTEERSARRETYCLGEFRSADGSVVSHEVEVHGQGRCAPGVRKPARLVRGGSSDLFSGNERDVAWVPGATGWIINLVLTALFGAPLLFFGLLTVRKARRRPSPGSETEKARSTPT
jgi:type IV secretory pathway TrbD component